MRNIVFSFICFLFIMHNISYGQNKSENNNILLIVKAFCLDSLQKDTLIIKEGKPFNDGVFFNYSKISKSGKYIHIQHFYEEQHFDDNELCTTLLPAYNYPILQEDFMYALEAEILKCVYNKNKRGFRLSYEILHEINKNPMFYDSFGYALSGFLEHLRPMDLSLQNICPDSFSMERTTVLIESYSTPEIKYDTIVTEIFRCPNGDFKKKFVSDTEKQRERYSYSPKVNSTVQLVTIDSTESSVLRMYKMEDSSYYYRKIYRGHNYTNEIIYDSEWVAAFIFHYKNTKKNKYERISMIELKSDRTNIKYNDYTEWEKNDFIGICSREKWFETSNSDLKPEPVYLFVRRFNRGKWYQIEHNKKVHSGTIFYKNEKIIKEKALGSKEVTRYKYDKSNNLLEVRENQFNKLIRKKSYIYEKGLNSLAG